MKKNFAQIKKKDKIMREVASNWDRLQALFCLCSAFYMKRSITPKQKVLTLENSSLPKAILKLGSMFFVFLQCLSSLLTFLSFSLLGCCILQCATVAFPCFPPLALVCCPSLSLWIIPITPSPSRVPQSDSLCAPIVFIF